MGKYGSYNPLACHVRRQSVYGWAPKNVYKDVVMW